MVVGRISLVQARGISSEARSETSWEAREISSAVGKTSLVEGETSWVARMFSWGVVRKISSAVGGTSWAVCTISSGEGGTSWVGVEGEISWEAEGEISWAVEDVIFWAAGATSWVEVGATSWVEVGVTSWVEVVDEIFWVVGTISLAQVEVGGISRVGHVTSPGAGSGSLAGLVPLASRIHRHPERVAGVRSTRGRSTAIHSRRGSGDLPDAIPPVGTSSEERSCYTVQAEVVQVEGCCNRSTCRRC